MHSISDIRKSFKPAKGHYQKQKANIMPMEFL